MAIDIAILLLNLFLLLLFARFAVNLIFLYSRSWKPAGMSLILVEGVLSLTDPSVRFVRASLPEINLGSVRLDLSILVLMILTTVAIYILSMAR